MASNQAMLWPLASAIAIGLLIGLERGWTERDEDDGHRVAGIRTFGLLGLVGGVAGLIAGMAGGVVLASCGAVLALGYVRQARAVDGKSATGTIAGILVLGLGALATSGRPGAALGCGALAMFLLSSRQRLHALVNALSPTELRAAAEFALVALVLFPLAPDTGIGPFGAINPHRLLLMVVLVCAASFAAYLAAHHLSRGKGTFFAAAAGGLVSSTAVTAALAHRLRGAAVPKSLVAAIQLTSIVGGLRVLVLIAILAPDAVGRATVAILPGLAVLVAAALLYWDDMPDAKDGPRLAGNPLELGAAIALAVIAALAMLAARFAAARWGETSVLVVFTATGFADVDAAILAYSSLPVADRLGLAGYVLAAPVAANMLLKAMTTMIVSRTRHGIRAALPLAICAAAIASAVVLGWADA